MGQEKSRWADVYLSRDTELLWKYGKNKSVPDFPTHVYDLSYTYFQVNVELAGEVSAGCASADAQEW